MGGFGVDEVARNMSQNNSTASAPPTILVCVLFSLAFESPYVLPWIAHHTILGVDHFDMYLDDVSPTWVPQHAEDHADLLALLNQSAAVTLHSMRMLGLEGQGDQLAHCVSETMGRADWVGGWDIDENMGVGLPVNMKPPQAAADHRDAVAAAVAAVAAATAYPAAAAAPDEMRAALHAVTTNVASTGFHGRLELERERDPLYTLPPIDPSINALKDALSKIAEDVTGIKISRVDIGSVSRHAFPEEKELMFSQYVDRYGVHRMGKSMWRPCSQTYPAPIQGHNLIVAERCPRLSSARCRSTTGCSWNNVRSACGGPELGKVILPNGYLLSATVAPKEGSTTLYWQSQWTIRHNYNTEFFRQVSARCAVRLGAADMWKAQAELDFAAGAAGNAYFDEEGKNVNCTTPFLTVSATQTWKEKRGHQNPCPYHVVEWDRSKRKASLALVTNVKVFAINLRQVVAEKSSGGHRERQKQAHGMDHGTFVPSFTMPFRLYNYKRSTAECEWKLRVQSEKGSIFDQQGSDGLRSNGRFNESARMRLLKKQCLEKEKAREYIVKHDKGRQTDHTLGNVVHVKMIYATMKVLFGTKGVLILHQEKRRLREKLNAVVKNDTLLF
jgi:hypothetical protein